MLTLIKILGFGAVAGMRAMVAHALAADYVDRNPTHSSLDRIGSDPVKWALRVMAAGELVADKLPGMPSRTKALPLVGRLISGAVAGALVAKANKAHPVVGAVLGGTAAVAAAELMERARATLDEKLGLPDAVVGAAEDAVALKVGQELLQNA